MLKHLPRSGMDFLHIFNLFWSLHSFPSIWKTSSIIPIHNMGHPLDFPASFQPISLASCISKLFERIILLRLLFFLKRKSILSPHQAGFHPGWSTLDQLLFLSQSILNGCNKLKPGFWTILATLDFSNALTLSNIPSFFTNIFWLASFLALLVRLNLSFLIGVLAWFFKITGNRSFRSFLISLPFSVSCCFHADDLAIGSSSLLVSAAVETTQRALIRLEC